MNEELEEFKENIIIELDKVLESIHDRNNLVNPVTYSKIKGLIKKLKPVPKFIEGEIVEFSGGREVMVGTFEGYSTDPSYQFKHNSGLWSNCKKLEALPMNMTVYNGINRPDDDCLVFVRREPGFYNGGMAGQFNWAHINKFQILKDLKP